MKRQKIYWLVLAVALAFTVYLMFSYKKKQNLDYFVPLANSMIHGHLDIPFQPRFEELVPISGKYFVVFPPMPAVILIPAVAIMGLDFNQVWASVFLAALSVGLFYLLIERFTKKLWVAISTTVLFGFGTNFFFTSLAGIPWYFAHIVAIFFLLLAMLEVTSSRPRPAIAGLWLSGAFLSRLPTILSIPIFIYLILKESHPGNRARTTAAFFAPIIIAILLFGLYNWSRFGSFFQTGYSLIPGVLQEPWYTHGIFSLSYLPRQLSAIFLYMPKIMGKFPFFQPSNTGMALWLTTPALLLLPFAKSKQYKLAWFYWTALLVAAPLLLHGTVGFTQFGYRHSLDFILLLLIPLAFAFERLGRKISLAFVGLCLLINFWGALLFQLGILRY